LIGFKVPNIGNVHLKSQCLSLMKDESKARVGNIQNKHGMIKHRLKNK